MPVEFTCSKSQLLEHCPPPRTQISSKKLRELGYLRNRRGFDGIATLHLKALLNTEKSTDSHNLIHTQTGLPMRTWKPEWWPEYVDKIYLPQVDYPQSLFNIIP